ncbi:NAD(P)-binding protein [Sphingomonas quercus]|uniref:NAD(P)-binding protein n=1 Tax=Sphingomonas quercus TaxID=2842451 RepID=A0ABS6BI08_9SPHN|nr:NAD(P)-binding protein [Sphingomonas quercus]MBU3077933.1 NAD(P)-binding protein [Sphingomonas quercus]
MVDAPKTPARDLGMGCPITRRDILHGGAIGLAAAMAGGLSGCGGGTAAQQAAGGAGASYPPLRTGLRGSHPGSFEVAHALRDGQAMAVAADAPAEEHYDLIVVGGGISGLSAAIFYRDARPDARILILENHDDFGGHAKRNEFERAGRIELMNGGTQSIESPFPYSAVADRLIRRIGIDVPALEVIQKKDFYRKRGMGRATFFDKETFGADKLVPGLGSRPWAEALADAPLSPAARRDIERIETARIDYMPGLTSDQKKDRLSRISYADYLIKVAKADPAVLPYYQHRSLGLWGVGIDGVSALDLWGTGASGFEGLDLAKGAIERMGFTPKGYAATGGSYELHFPDGNATVARLLVRALIPDALPGKTAADSILARVDYARLDRDGQPTRLRLNSTVVHARNAGEGVEIVYSRDGKLHKIAARDCVMACWNMIIPYLCPDLPDKQKAALHELVKVPLVYTSVSLTNWQAFDMLKISSLSFPGGYFQNASLNPMAEIGGYAGPASPNLPILVHMTRTPCSPGLSEHDQCRAGRAELLATPFETFEHHVRDQLGRALAGGGFDPARDIDAITVNRWPHGYAPEYNPLWDAETTPDQAPNVIGRQRHGRIAIANADSGRAAYTDSAIDQAHRAVGELLGA